MSPSHSVFMASIITKEALEVIRSPAADNSASSSAGQSMDSSLAGGKSGGTSGSEGNGTGGGDTKRKAKAAGDGSTTSLMSNFVWGAPADVNGYFGDCGWQVGIPLWRDFGRTPSG